MQRICAWCGNKLPDGPDPDLSDYPVSHGICESCADNLLFQGGVELARYLDSLEQPVVLVDAEGVVRTANRAARDMLGKELSSIEGFRGGDVFECSHARLPGGCGNTEHCSGCSIRRAVMETMESGRGESMKEAFLSQHTEEGLIRRRLSISTEKVGDLVFLRIDGMT